MRECCRRKASHSGTYESTSDIRQPGGNNCEASLRLDVRFESAKRAHQFLHAFSFAPYRRASCGSCPIRRAMSPPTFNRSANASATEFVGIRRWLIHSASRRDSRSSESRPYIELKLVTPIPPTREPRTHSPRAFSSGSPVGARIVFSYLNRRRNTSVSAWNRIRVLNATYSGHASIWRTQEEEKEKKKENGKREAVRSGGERGR
jgi:hypothetical protein